MLPYTFSRLYVFIVSFPVMVTCNFDQQKCIHVTSDRIFKSYNRRIYLRVSELNKSKWSHGGELKKNRNTYILP